MNAKNIRNKIFSRYLLLHFLAMAVVVVLLGVGVAFGLDMYTHHGEGIEVPELKGMDFEKAYRQLEEMGLSIVVSDSDYNKSVPADAILAQTPSHGQRVKQGHVIYVTVNSPTSPTFALPDIVDTSSLREAEAKLTSMGFRLMPPMRVEGEKDWVYGIVCRGRRVSNGDRLSIDYPLTLMVGKGSTDYADSIEYVESVFGPTTESTVDEFEEVKEP